MTIGEPVQHVERAISEPAVALSTASRLNVLLKDLDWRIKTGRPLV